MQLGLAGAAEDVAQLMADELLDVGTGDTFTGYFFQGVLGGGTVEEALRAAARASAIAVTRPGAGGSIPAMAEVAALL